MKLLTSSLVLGTATAEWGHLRVGRLRRLEMSMSMSLPAQDMSMSLLEAMEFEQFDAELGSLSMSAPAEEMFADFDRAQDASMSISMPIAEEGIEQFNAYFGSISMSIPEEEFVFEIHGYSVSMSMPGIGSLSMSIPEEEIFDLLEPELVQFNNGFGESDAKETESDDFFFMPIFDDRTDVFEEEKPVMSLSMSLPLESLDQWAMEEIEIKPVMSLSISMSLPMEDLDQWTVEEDLDFFENELSHSMSMSI